MNKSKNTRARLENVNRVYSTDDEGAWLVVTLGKPKSKGGRGRVTLLELSCTWNCMTGLVSEKIADGTEGRLLFLGLRNLGLLLQLDGLAHCILFG